MPETQPVHIEWNSFSEYFDQTVLRSSSLGQSHEIDFALYRELFNKLAKSRLWNQAYSYEAQSAYYLHPISQLLQERTIPPIDEDEKERFYQVRLAQLTPLIEADNERLTRSLHTYLMYQRALTVYIMNAIQQGLDEPKLQDRLHTRPDMYSFIIGFSLDKLSNSLLEGTVPDYPKDMKAHTQSHFPYELRQALSQEIKLISNTLERNILDLFHTFVARHQGAQLPTTEQLLRHFTLDDKQFTMAPHQIPIANHHTTCPAVNYSRSLRNQLVENVQQYWQENGITE